MNGHIRRQDVRKWLGKRVTAIRKDGTRLTGKLVRIKGNCIYVRPDGRKNKPVKVRGLIPLVLFDLLAIGRPGVWGGGYPYGPYGGYPYGGTGYGPYGGGFGYPGGFFW